MMATKESVVLHEIKDKILPDLHQFRDFLRMVIPRHNEDQSEINLCVDMITDMATDIDGATQLTDLNTWFAIRDLTENWDMVANNNIVSTYSVEVQRFIEAVVQLYDNDTVTEGDIT